MKESTSFTEKEDTKQFTALVNEIVFNKCCNKMPVVCINKSHNGNEYNLICACLKCRHIAIIKEVNIQKLASVRKYLETLKRMWNGYY